MNVRRIEAIQGPLSAKLEAPSSKSVTHRALVAAALARGDSTIDRPLIADDTLVTRAGLDAIGVPIRTAGETWIVKGCGGTPAGGGLIELGDSGTSLRFLTAVAALGSSPSRFDGSARLAERPIDELVAALGAIGASLTQGRGRSLPLSTGGRGVAGGTVRLPGSRSSQFASALLLIGARLPRGIDVALDPPAVSVPYVELTARVLAAFGVPVQRVEPLRWRVSPCDYAAARYEVEGDHSTASYFLAAAAVVGGRVRVERLDPDSAQPDARLGDLLERIGSRVVREASAIEVIGEGKLGGFEVDLSDAPDLAPTVAVLALFAEGPSVIHGLAHLRFKESDRLELLGAGLASLGRDNVATADRLEVAARTRPLHGGRITTRSDHRMAMAFAVAGLRIHGVEIEDPDCVAKSHPGFWAQFAALSRSDQNW